MKKIIILLTASIISYSPLMAVSQDLKLKGIFGAVYNQTGVSDNWSGQEKDSKSWGVSLDASAEKDYTDTKWLSVLKEGYGKSEVTGTPEQISLDLIDFTSVFSYDWTRLLNPYVGLAVTTVNNTFLDPVTYVESAGIGWALLRRDTHHLNVRTGFAYKQIFSSTTEAYRQTGAECVVNYDVLLSSNTKFVSEARTFTAFKGGGDLRWDNSLFVKVSKYVTIQLNYLEIYDSQRIPKPVWPNDIETRFTVSIGLSYDLF